MKRIALLLAVCATPAMATDIADFTPTQQGLYITMQAATLVDWAQTRGISQSCGPIEKDPNRPGYGERRFKEANPLLGECPSVGRVNNFMAGRLVLQHFAAKAMPDEYRTPVLATLNIAYGAIVARNHSMQVRQDYGNDKAQHFIAGGAIGGLTAAITKSPTAGCLLGIGAGIAKEAYDRSHGGKANASDALVTAAGACLAAKFAGWTFGPGRVTYRREF